MGEGHWANSLPLPEGFVYRVRHCESDAVVHSGRYVGSMTPEMGASTVAGHGILFVGETYAIEVAAGTGVHATMAHVTIESVEMILLNLPLRRASAPVLVRLLSAYIGSGSWAAALPLPP